MVALNGLQVLFAQVIFQSIRDEGGVADKVVHIRMQQQRNKTLKNILLHVPRATTITYSITKFSFLSKQTRIRHATDAVTHSHTNNKFSSFHLILIWNETEIKKYETIAELYNYKGHLERLE